MKNNKTDKIAQLAEQNGRHLFQTAYRLLGDKHLAEDIVQEVFLKLFKNSEADLKKIQNWPAYLKVMTTSTSYDLLRKKTRQAEQALEESKSVTDSKTLDAPDKQLMLSRDMTFFRKALSQISQLEANVFSLRFIEEFSYQEIAEQLNITNSNVGITLSRAKQSLSNLLKESNFLGASYETK